MPEAQRGAREQPAQERAVVILGRASLQYTLLSALIEKRTGVPCVIRCAQVPDGFPVAGQVLALLDVEGLQGEALESSIAAVPALAGCRTLALFNADEDLPFEKVLLHHDVRGVFFKNATQDNVLRGIRAIFQGEYWVPRRILCDFLERSRGAARAARDGTTALTPKEVQTLRLLAGGHSTSLIATALHVSPHTVKTHIYNLFRKIRVSNRVQATRWALRNLDGVERGAE